MSVSKLYLRGCKLLDVVPVSYFIRNLDSASMTLSHRGLRPLGCKALAIALVVSLKINSISVCACVFFPGKAFLTRCLYLV